MFIPFLVLGSLWGWAALVIPFLIIIACVENERGVGAFITIALTAVLWVAFGQRDLVPWLLHNPKQIGIYAGLYVLLGIVWGFVKWFFYVLRIRDKYADFRAQWVQQYGEIDDTVSTQQPRGGNITKREAFMREVKSDGLLPPRALSNKGRIIFWMGYWPASALWTLLNDPLRHLWNFVYGRLGLLFEKISQALFSKYESDFVVKKD